MTLHLHGIPQVVTDDILKAMSETHTNGSCNHRIHGACDECLLIVITPRILAGHNRFRLPQC